MALRDILELLHRNENICVHTLMHTSIIVGAVFTISWDHLGVIGIIIALWNEFILY